MPLELYMSMDLSDLDSPDMPQSWPPSIDRRRFSFRLLSPAQERRAERRDLEKPYSKNHPVSGRPAPVHSQCDQIQSPESESAVHQPLHITQIVSPPQAEVAQSHDGPFLPLTVHFTESPRNVEHLSPAGLRRKSSIAQGGTDQTVTTSSASSRLLQTTNIFGTHANVATETRLLSTYHTPKEVDFSSVSHGTKTANSISSQLIAILQSALEPDAPQLDSDVSQEINTLLAKLISRGHPGTASSLGASGSLYPRSLQLSSNAPASVGCSENRREPVVSAHVAPNNSLPSDTLSSAYNNKTQSATGGVGKSAVATDFAASALRTASRTAGDRSDPPIPETILGGVEDVVSPESALRPNIRPFRSSTGSGDTVWYQTALPTPLSHPSPSIKPEVADLYIHKNTRNDSLQIWLCKRQGQWESISVEFYVCFLPDRVVEGAAHPMFPDRVLKIRMNGEPSWVTKQSCSTIKSRKK